MKVRYTTVGTQGDDATKFTNCPMEHIKIIVAFNFTLAF